jgi:hypothetical protein
MEVDDIKAGFDSSTDSRDKVLLKLLNLVNSDDTGNRIAWSKRLVTRAHNIIRPSASRLLSCKSSILPRSNTRGLATGMTDLNADKGVVGVCKVNMLTESFDV